LGAHREPGNTSHPNEYSNNLLNNLGNLTGTKPYIRVGGSSADEAVLDTNLANATTHKQDTGLPSGPQQQLKYGNSYFQSFGTWPDARYIYDFNMAFNVGDDADTGFSSLNGTIPLICQALADGRFLYWEYGNEPNLYQTQSHGYVDAASWTAQSYLQQWQNGTSVIKEQLQADPNCAELAGSDFGFIGPSLWIPASHPTLTLGSVWSAGLDSADDLRMIAMHRYASDSKLGHLTISNTLLNHTLNTHALQTVVSQWADLGDKAPPLMIGETNSIANVGIQGMTDTFAGALWAMDWALWCASQNVSRIHFQQGLNFWYNAWHPVMVNSSVGAGTKPPYYGHMAAAGAVGESTEASVQVLAHESSTDVDGVYSVFSDGTLSRVAVVNLRSFTADDPRRGTQTYTFKVPDGPDRKSVLVRRLVGPSSDALGGVQWDGQQFDITSNGLSTATNNATTGEHYLVCNGIVSVTLDDSSAAVLEFMA
jgi:Glycosyl hydrolase family 79 C-terminal beta domain